MCIVNKNVAKISSFPCSILQQIHKCVRNSVHLNHSGFDIGSPRVLCS